MAHKNAERSLPDGKYISVAARTLCCQQISIEPDLITVTVESMASQGICPLCGRLSSREHSRYKRQLSDLPWQGRAVRLNLLSKKYFCDFPGCARRIFVARLREVATAYARKTVRLVDTLANIAFMSPGGLKRFSRTFGESVK